VKMVGDLRAFELFLGLCAYSGIAPLDDTTRRDLLEILDDRFDRRSTLVTSQLPLAHSSGAQSVQDRDDRGVDAQATPFP